MIRGTTARWKTWIVVAVGAFVVLYGIGTLAVMPWRYSGAGVAGTILQILASLGGAALGIALAWLAVTSARKK